jgi:hypothetical protein
MTIVVLAADRQTVRIIGPHYNLDANMRRAMLAAKGMTGT